jgi:hypothetical protein
VDVATVCLVPTVADVLSGRPYPGRGCLVARTVDGALCFTYFLTGRSPASRARAITVRELAHDALRHYVAGARRGPWVVVGNGEQVIPIAESLDRGDDVITTWGQHTYEPDPPIFTPRIWVATCTNPATPDCLIGYARRSDRGDGATDRITWSTSTIAAGSGALMTTYDGNAEEIRTTTAPRDVITTSPTARDLANEVWTALDPALRIAAFTLEVARFDSALISSP